MSLGNESEFLDWLRSQQLADGFVRVSAGDDLAVLKWKSDDLLLIGTDQVLDGVHFDSSIHSPRAIGGKVMNRNLSDCAAMACVPAAAVVTLALPRGKGIEFAKEVYLGVKEAAAKFNCPIVGGDTGTWPGKLVATVTILGRSDGIDPVKRSGARPGDGLFVTGALGGSLRGRHMTFIPRVELARVLAKSSVISSMMDISDGLSRDLPRLCDASGVGAVVDAALIPIHEDAIESRGDGRSQLEHALHDGEDYELLFTCADKTLSTARLIGVIASEPGAWIEQDGLRQPLEAKGWDHSL